MREIASLVDFLRIICDRPNMVDYDKKRDARYLASMNAVVKEYIGMEAALSGKESKHNLPEENLLAFIDENYEYIYSHQHRRDYEKNVDSPEEKRNAFFYRGVSNNTYPIAPGIYRRNERHEENYYFNEIGVRCPDAFRSANNLEKLTYMQHYGCPTRLLDITSNPLVALYFACLGGEDHDGAIYIFGVSPDEVRYANSDRIQMLCKLAEFKAEGQKHLRYLAYRNIRKGKFSQISNGKYQDTLVEQYYHAIKRNNGAFEREIVPFDMLKPQFVQPNKDNPRILKQDGAFIVSGLDRDDRESDMKIRKYLVDEITIPAKSKARILEELALVGINQATLFPEVDKVADYLRNRI